MRPPTGGNRSKEIEMNIIIWLIVGATSAESHVDAKAGTLPEERASTGWGP
jgi:hypothetical protein